MPSLLRLSSTSFVSASIATTCSRSFSNKVGLSSPDLLFPTAFSFLLPSLLSPLHFFFSYPSPLPSFSLSNVFSLSAGPEEEAEEEVKVEEVSEINITEEQAKDETYLLHLGLSRDQVRDIRSSFVLPHFSTFLSFF